MIKVHIFGFNFICVKFVFSKFIINDFHDVVEKILIEIVVDFKQEMKVHLFWGCYFRCLTNKLIAVTILIYIVDQKPRLHSCRLILVKVTTCPFIHCHNFFSLIVDKVNWSDCHFSPLEIKSTEH